MDMESIRIEWNGMESIRIEWNEMKNTGNVPVQCEH